MNNIRIQHLLALCFVCATMTLTAQTWVYNVERFYDPDYEKFIHLEPHGIDGYILWEQHDSSLVKLDRHGRKQPFQSNLGVELAAFRQTPDGGYIAITESGNPTLPASSPELIKLRSDGSVEFRTAYDGTIYGTTPPDVRATVDGGYVFLTHQDHAGTQSDIQLTKVNATGQIQWTQQYGDTSNQYPLLVIPTPDTGYAIVGTTHERTSVGMIFLIKTDAQGDTVWTRSYADFSDCNSIEATFDGGYVLGVDSVYHGKAAKLSATGQLTWLRSNRFGFGPWVSVWQRPDTGYMVLAHNNLMRLDPQGNTIWDRPLLPRIHPTYGDMVFAPDGGYVLSGMVSFPFPSDWKKGAVVKTDSEGIATRNLLDGQVYIDQNNDCLYNAGDDSLGGLVVQAMDANGVVFYGTTDANGYYRIPVVAGTYGLRVDQSIHNPYISRCGGPSIAVVDSMVLTATTDLGYTVSTYCPYMTVSISAGLLRRGIDSSAIYHLRYCNSGTAAAHQAYVEVTLDSHYVLQGSTLPVASQQGHTYRFNLDTVPEGTCGYISLYGYIDLQALPGQIHCAEANIYPDSACVPISYPIIETHNACNGADTLLFFIKNIGRDMIQPMKYHVFEDHLMLSQGTFVLDSLAQDTIPVRTQPGHWYRIAAEQSVGAQAVLSLDPIAWSFRESCQIGNASSWNINNYYLRDGSPTRSVNCRPNRGSYDPNDKTGYPLGYGNDHYILPNLPLEYRIRFQNTGNDTAFRVVIVDTLPPSLDAATLQIQTSSHPMTWQVYGNNILEVTYDPIALPDSNVNEPLSHGFVTFQIDHVANLPLPTVVQNSAAIYFDANPPIITNTTLHTIDTGFVEIEVSVEEPFLPQVTVNVFPNPFQMQTTMQVEGLPQMGEALQLEVYDVMGRLVQQQQSDEHQFTIHRRSMTQGVYFYRIQYQGRLVSTGRMVVGP